VWKGIIRGYTRKPWKTGWSASTKGGCIQVIDGEPCRRGEKKQVNEAGKRHGLPTVKGVQTGIKKRWVEVFSRRKSNIWQGGEKGDPDVREGVPSTISLEPLTSRPGKKISHTKETWKKWERRIRPVA